MRRFLALLVATFLLTQPSVAPAAAASGQPVPVISIELTVDLIAPDVLSVHVDYTCLPEPNPVGSLVVTVTQSVPLAAQGEGIADMTCDGAGHEAHVTVVGGPLFAPGEAVASATGCTSLTCGMDSRKVVIPPLALQPATPATPARPAGPVVPGVTVPAVPAIPAVPAVTVPAIP